MGWGARAARLPSAPIGRPCGRYMPPLVGCCAPGDSSLLGRPRVACGRAGRRAHLAGGATGAGAGAAGEGVLGALADAQHALTREAAARGGLDGDGALAACRARLFVHFFHHGVCRRRRGLVERGVGGFSGAGVGDAFGTALGVRPLAVVSRRCRVLGGIGGLRQGVSGVGGR